MKVLHVVPTYLPATRYGGPIASVHGLCKGLSSLGVDVDVVTTSVDGNSDSPVPHGQAVCSDGVNVWYFKSSRLRRLYWSPDMRDWLQDNVRHYDVVHVHSVFLYPTLVACRIALKQKVPYVLAPRGMLVDDLIRTKSHLLKRLWIRLFDRQHVRRASALHLTSVLEQLELSRVIAHDVPNWVVPNGVDVSPRNDWQGSSGRNIVLFIGRLNWKKGLDNLVRAVAAGAMGHYVIAGNDEEDYRIYLDGLIAEFKLEQRFEFVGPVYGESKQHLLRESDLFVMPSVNENFGIAALEAMAEGCPTLVSEGSGLVSEVIEESLKTTDIEPEALALSINLLLEDSDERQRLSGLGYEAAQALGWPAIAQDMLEHYRKLCA